MPGLLDGETLDLAEAVSRLRELRARGRSLLACAAVLCGLGAAALALSQSFGYPLLIGAAAAVGLAGLCRTDRRRLLVRLVAQGDASRVADVCLTARRLVSPAQRRRLADGLRAAAECGQTGAQRSMMVDPARADGMSTRLQALAEAFADPLVLVSAQAAALCRCLLCEPMRSPLYNPHVSERELERVLDVLERGVSRA